MPFPSGLTYAAADGSDKSVSKTDPFPTLETCSAFTDSQQASVTTTAAAIATTLDVAFVQVQAHPDNTDNILLGDASGQHWVLQAGGERVIPIDDPAKVWAKSVSGTQVLNIWTFQP